MANKSDTEKAKAFDEIKEMVDSHGGVLTVPMRILREAHGASGLGPLVVDDIQNHLNIKGIGWSPSELPTSSGRNVRLYTLVSRFQESLKRYSGRISPTDDEVIRKQFTCDSLYEETVNKIRNLLEMK